MKIIQVKLRNTDKPEQLTTWVDKRPGLVKGSWLRLKDFKPSETWEVIELYNVEHEASKFDWHRKWTNNI